MTVAGEHNRQVRIDGVNKMRKCLCNIAIGCVERHLTLGLVGHERTDCRLAIARRPDLARLVKRAGHSAQIYACDAFRLFITKFGVPARPTKVTGRMDEKDCKIGW